MKTVITTDKAPRPIAPYSQGLRAGSCIYVAGPGPMNVAAGAVPEGIKAQTAQALENIRAILEAGGAGLDDVVKVTVHLADLNLFKEFNEVYAT
jgi:2-iminobutanoate/2-iminopropanoate deaminase